MSVYSFHSMFFFNAVCMFACVSVVAMLIEQVQESKPLLDDNIATQMAVC